MADYYITILIRPSVNDIRVSDQPPAHLFLPAGNGFQKGCVLPLFINMTSK